MLSLEPCSEQDTKTDDLKYRLVAGALLVVMLVAILCNTGIICTMLRSRFLRRRAYSTLLWLCVADVVTALLGIPVDVSCILFLGHPEVLRVLLRVRSSLFNALLTLSAWCLALTSMDRCLTVLYPMRYLQVVTNKRVRYLYVFTFVYAFGLFAVTILLDTFSNSFQCDVRRSAESSMVVSIQIHIAIIASLVLNVRLYKIAMSKQCFASCNHSRHGSSMRSDASSQAVSSPEQTIDAICEQEQDKEKQSFRLLRSTFSKSSVRMLKKSKPLTLIMFLSVLCWMPPAVTAVISCVVTDSKSRTDLRLGTVEEITHWLAYLHTAISPVLLCLTQPTLQAAVSRRLGLRSVQVRRRP